MTKRCATCGKEKSLREFKVSGRNRSPEAHCRECAKARARHKYAANPGPAREKTRRYAKRNAEKVKAATRRWRQANSTRLGTYNQEWKRQNAYCVILCHVRQRARIEGLPFTITKEWLKQRLDAGVCEVTGISFEAKGERGPWCPSLDQIIPGLGYTPTNTQVVVWAYNAAKGVWAHADVIRLARAVLRREEITEADLPMEPPEEVEPLAPASGAASLFAGGVK